MVPHRRNATVVVGLAGWTDLAVASFCVGIGIAALAATPKSRLVLDASTGSLTATATLGMGKA